MRSYGQAPFSVVVVHGGPGAAGEMAPVARELASGLGVLEPFQVAASLEGQVEELAGQLAGRADLPASLVGHSWGAWLILLVAARHPVLVRKLILVGSGPFEERYVAQLRRARLGRLDPDEQAAFNAAVAALADPAVPDRDALLARLGALARKADSYDPIPAAVEPLPVRADLYRQVWAEADALRSSGELLHRVARVGCPVVAIHGDHDPHPAAGVEAPLSAILPGFRFILLQNCGHTPWIERQARDAFYRVLRAELDEAVDD
jgi:pimeloyl-ACP methyl ester carboxylesterase